MERSRRIANTLKGVFPFVQADRLGAQAGIGLRILYGALFLLVVAAVIGVSAVVILNLGGSNRQVVQITFHDVQGATISQSAVVNKEEDLVTYHIMDRNYTTVVLFDSKNGLVCYQLGRNNICLVRKMLAADQENIHTVITAQEQKFNQLLLLRNETQFSREYLGILSRKKVDPLTLGQHIDSLCNQTPVYWLQKSNRHPKDSSLIIESCETPLHKKTKAASIQFRWTRHENITQLYALLKSWCENEIY